MKRILLCAFVMLSLSACQNQDKSAYVKKTEAEHQIDQLRADYQNKLEASTKAIEEKKIAVIHAKDAQQQAVANAFYGQSLVFRSIMEPTRTDLVLMNLSEEGWLAIGHLLPDYATMLSINQRIATELDVAKTTLADLRKNHETVLAQNQKLVDATLAKVKELADLDKARVDAEKEYRKTLDAKQVLLNQKHKEIEASQRAELDSKKARDEQLAKLSWGAGGLAVLCLIGALFSPLFKTELAIAGAILGGAAVSIPFIELWMVLTTVGTIGAGIAAWIVWKHYFVRKELKTETAINTDHIRALQRIKEKAPGVWQKTIKPELEEAHMKYVEKDGVVTKEPDPTRKAFIEKRLADVGDK